MFNTIKVNNTDTNYTHSIFDISEYTGKKYDTLSDALTDVPDGKQSGGMTVRFVSTSDNNYVQYKLIKNEFTTNVIYWQRDYDLVAKRDAIPLAENTDLNTLSFGLYSFTAEVKPTLVNAPDVTAGGYLIVEKTTVANNTYNKQTMIFAYAMRTFIRYNYCQWKEYAYADVLETLSDSFNKNAFHYTAYFAGCNYLNIEETNRPATGLYFKPTSEVQEFNIFGPNGTALLTFANWAAVATALNYTFVTSPSGLTNCIQLTVQQVLVFDTTDVSLKIKTMAQIKITDIVLIQTNGGRCTYVNQGLLNPKDIGDWISNHEAIVYFGGSSPIIIEETNSPATGLYFKPNREEVDLRFFKPTSGNAIAIANNWAAVATMLNYTFVTSPKGLTNCIQLINSEALVFNINTKSLSIKSTFDNGDIVLLRVAGGRCIYVNQGLYNANDVLKSIKSIGKLENRIYPYTIYFVGCNYLTIEESGTVGNGIYLKPTDTTAVLNIFGPNGTAIKTISTWANFATEVGRALVTSAGGVEDCLQLLQHEALVFDTVASALSIKVKENILYSDIILARNVAGRCLDVYPGLYNVVDVDDIISKHDNIISYFGGDSPIIVEEVSDGLYFKPQRENVEFKIINYHNTNTLLTISNWAAFATALNRELVTSPDGMINSFHLYNKERIVFNIYTKRFSIKSILVNGDIILIQVMGGRCVYLNQGLYNATDVKNSETTEYIPSWWEAHMETKVGTINKKCYAIGNNGDNFVFITDIHNEGNAENSPNLIRYILNNTSVRNVIIGGDLLSAATSREDACDKIQLLRNKYNFTDRIFSVRGNHDVAVDSDTNITFGDYYSIMERPLENIIDTNRLPYYYRDNLSQKIRYIFIDAYGSTESALDADQVSWIKAKARELQTGWSVVFIAHLYWHVSTGATNTVLAIGTYLKNLINELINGVSGDNPISPMDAKVIALVVGHVHRDKIEFVSTTEQNYWIIGTTCDKGGTNNFDPDHSTRTFGTIHEHAFDVYNIDTYHDDIFLTRIGEGGDRTIHSTVETVSTGNTITLTSELSGTLTWNSNDTGIVTVASNVVTGIASGTTFVWAEDENGNKEYFVIKCQ